MSVLGRLGAGLESSGGGLSVGAHNGSPLLDLVLAGADVRNGGREGISPVSLSAEDLQEIVDGEDDLVELGESSSEASQSKGSFDEIGSLTLKTEGDKEVQGGGKHSGQVVGVHLGTSL